jgi:predicted transcriptional regulator
MSSPRTLGQLLEELRRDGDPLTALEGDLSLVLLGRIDRLAEVEGTSRAAVVRAAVEDFVAHADDEQWATLIGRLEAAETPGTACAETILSRYLAARGT